MIATQLLTEYLQDPMGIDIPAPRLFWTCEGGGRQTAYQVTANKQGRLVWDSGKVPGASMRCRWGGPALGSRAAVTWKVRLWDETDTPDAWSEPARFELGLLRPEDWRAQWITGDYKPQTHKTLLGDYAGRAVERYPADCFRKEFTVQNVKSARLYITACGLYEATLNGQRVGGFRLAPGYTDYRKRVQYQTYDVGPLLQKGTNVLTIQLGDGWYRGSVGAWGLLCAYGDETKLLAQLECTDAAGKRKTIATDASWQWSNDGPIRFMDNKDGERVDARMAPSYRGTAKLTRHNVVPSASNNVPVLEHEHFTPTVLTTPGGKTVLDFGQNIAGYVEFTVQARAGQRVLLRLGEMLDKDGEFTQKNIQFTQGSKCTPRQQIEYLCAEGTNHYKTTFAFFGFRYALLETDTDWRAEDFTAIAVYSDLARTGWFESSDPLLNKLVEITVWSTKGNALDLPTDCPTRERHGWTGDAQIFCETANWLFRYIPLAQKYLEDVYDVQSHNGRLPQIAPVGGTDFFMKVMDGSVGWADVGVLVPLRLALQYGDRDILQRYYDRMTRYARFMQRRCGKRVPIAKPLDLHGKARRYAVNAGQSYGEWAEPTEVHPGTWKDQVYPHPEESTAYTCYVMEAMAQICTALDKPAEAAEYQRFADNVRGSYQALSRLEDFTLDTDRQARLVRPLYMNLLDPAQKTFAQTRLLQALERFGWRLGTGFLSTPMILYVLAEIDLQAAYRLLENEQMPGWLFMPKSGATTIWESWEGTEGQGDIASLNHYSKGAVCQWLFDTMCGIQVVGENHFRFAPRPGGRCTHAKARYASIYGTVESGWQRDGDTVRYTFVVPANCTADLTLPGGTHARVAAGTHRFAEKAI